MLLLCKLTGLVNCTIAVRESGSIEKEAILNLLIGLHSFEEESDSL